MFPILSLGPLSIPAPAFILIVGYFTGSFLLDKKASSFSIDSEIIDRALWIGTISALIGARLSYIAGSPAAFQRKPTFNYFLESRAARSHWRPHNRNRCDILRDFHTKD